jgi:mRNA interferase HigB
MRAFHPDRVLAVACCGWPAASIAAIAGSAVCVVSTRPVPATPLSPRSADSRINEARKANWQQPSDIKTVFRNASILKNRRVVFNIKGNDYRLIVAVAYRFGALYIKFIGTHADYDAIDAETVEMEI